MGVSLVGAQAKIYGPSNLFLKGSVGGPGEKGGNGNGKRS